MLGDEIPIVPVEESGDIFRDFPEEALAGLTGAPCRVRRDDQIVQFFRSCNNGVIRRRRFAGYYIEGRSGDAAFAQRVDQGGFIDEGAACGVDQERAGFHQRERLPVD